MGYCGNKCDSCPALKATKSKDQEALARCAKEWTVLFGRTFLPETLHCDGCYNHLGRKANPECSIRPCCKEKGFMTCAECGHYPCARLRERFVQRAEIEAGLGRTIPEEIYQLYVRPLENKYRLELLHRKYKKES